MRIGTFVLAAVIALVLTGCFGDEDGTTEPVSSTASTEPEAALTGLQEIPRIGNRWAPRFAAGDRAAACELMIQPACERIACESTSGSATSCTPPPAEFRKSFRDATVQLVKIKGGYRAAAKFSNGEAVEFFGDGGRWLISKVGGNAGRGFFETKATLSPEQEIERIGNKWAPLFAAAPNPDACAGWDERHPYREVAAKYMDQPACEQAVCERISGPIKDCTPLSAGFQKSFADATVQNVAIKGRHRAAAKFSNGEAVELRGGWGEKQVDKLGPAWLIGKVGGNAGHGFFN